MSNEIYQRESNIKRGCYTHLHPNNDNVDTRKSFIQFMLMNTKKCSAKLVDFKYCEAVERFKR